MKNNIAIGAALGGAALLGALAVAYSSAQGDKTSGAAPAKSTVAPPPATPSTTTFSAAEEQAVRAIVRNYLIEHPEVLIEAMQSYDRKQETARLDLARSKLAVLVSPEHGYVAGANPAAAQVVVIELFDYHCGFCKKAVGLVRDLTKTDPSVKVVFRELPILREESEYAAKAALAARAQGKYQELHFAMMEAAGVLTKERVEEIAKSKGVDVARLKADIQSKSVKESLDETESVARDLEIDGTPTFIVASVNGEFVDVVSGFSAERVTEAIAEAKKAARKK
ncbi:MAG: DsbA family protein [Parvularculaceae bacterium]|nr:DsbA family protein [Parvularculaceae bacterium]